MHPLGTSAPVRAGRPGARRSRRGFTLLEVLAALMVASILAAAALPTMSTRIRERRAQQYAQQIALFYREGRTRAVGRGTSHMVRFSTAGYANGALTMYEAVQPIGGTANVGKCENLPMAGVDGCNTVTWATGANSRQVAVMGQQGTLYEEVFADFKVNNTTQSNVDICYSPGGRSYIRTAQNGPFLPFNSVQKVEVTRKSGGTPIDLLVRRVFLLPNGSTRVEVGVTGGAL